MLGCLVGSKTRPSGLWSLRKKTNVGFLWILGMYSFKWLHNEEDPVKCVMCRALLYCVRYHEFVTCAVEEGEQRHHWSWILRGETLPYKVEASSPNLHRIPISLQKKRCFFRQLKMLLPISKSFPVRSQVSEDGSGYRLHGFYWFVYEASPKSRRPTSIIGRNRVLSGLQRPDWWQGHESFGGPGSNIGSSVFLLFIFHVLCFCMFFRWILDPQNRHSKE